MGVAIIYAHAQLSSHNRARAIIKRRQTSVTEKNLFQIKSDVGMVLSHEQVVIYIKISLVMS